MIAERLRDGVLCEYGVCGGRDRRDGGRRWLPRFELRAGDRTWLVCESCCNLLTRELRAEGGGSVQRTAIRGASELRSPGTAKSAQQELDRLFAETYRLLFVPKGGSAEFQLKAAVRRQLLSIEWYIPAEDRATHATISVTLALLPVFYRARQVDSVGSVDVELWSFAQIVGNVIALERASFARIAA